MHTDPAAVRQQMLAALVAGGTATPADLLVYADALDGCGETKAAEELRADARGAKSGDKTWSVVVAPERYDYPSDTCYSEIFLRLGDTVWTDRIDWPCWDRLPYHPGRSAAEPYVQVGPREWWMIGLTYRGLGRLADSRLVVAFRACVARLGNDHRPAYLAAGRN